MGFLRFQFSEAPMIQKRESMSYGLHALGQPCVRRRHWMASQFVALLDFVFLYNNAHWS